MNHDEEHLWLLSIFHYVVAVVTAVFCSFPLIHVALGLAFIFSPDVFDGKGEPPPPWFGWLFVAVGSLFVMGGWTLAAAIAYAGRCLARRQNYLYCLVVAGLECLQAPFGTVLGVFTIVVLMRDSVKALFSGGRSSYLAPPTGDAP